jgi:2,5-diketo-D-gluconate reductase A
MEMSLGKDLTMPMIGFGTYLIDEDTVANTVYHALKSGYRHIDTAEAYRNEKGVGLGIQRAMKELGIDRKEIFVTTKLWPGNPAWGMEVKTYETTKQSISRSLKDLQLEYVDLYLIHAPLAVESRIDQWRALVDLKKEGKVKSIGVSNFNENHIEEIKSAGLPIPDANQIELHPWSQKPELVKYLRKQNIAIIAYSSLVPLSSWRAKSGQESAKSEKMKKDSENSPFKRMAEKYSVTEAQFLLRWGLQKGYAILPKSTSKERIESNFALNFDIEESDMFEIETMDRGDGVAWSTGDPLRSL